MKKNTIITTILLSASFLFISSLPLLPQISNSESSSKSNFEPNSVLPDYRAYPSELSPDNDPMVSRSLDEPRRSRTPGTVEDSKKIQKNESIQINQNGTAAKADTNEAPKPVTAARPAAAKSAEAAKPAYVAKSATTAKPAPAAKPAGTKPTVNKPANTQSTGSYSASDIDLLARLITAEAQGEPYSAQVGVGAVILNRIQSKEFPNTIPGVIYQTINGYAQFTPVVNGWIDKPALPGCIKAAKEALNGADPTNGALFYYDNTTTNQWILSKPISTKIGTMVYAY